VHEFWNLEEIMQRCLDAQVMTDHFSIGYVMVEILEHFGSSQQMCFAQIMDERSSDSF